MFGFIGEFLNKFLLLTCILLPVWASAQVAGNKFNPAISLILDGKLSSYSNDPDDYRLSGFQLANESGPEPEGFSLGESELDISANIDDKFYGFFTLALESEGSDTELELEEAYVQTTALPAGLTIKFGRFFSDIGYLNKQHAHIWDFVDEPLVYRGVLGTQYGDDGVQFRWVAPTDLFVELGTELLRGDDFPAAGAANDGLGTYTIFGHVGGDVGAENSWRAGLSYLSTEAVDRATELGPDESLVFNGDSDVAILDFVWKWAKNGNPRQRNFIFQTEYMYREEDGVLDFVDPNLTESGTYVGDQDGFYVQGVYQWRPKWRVGLRYDSLSHDNVVTGLTASTPLTDVHDPSRITAMIDWSHSEFSRLRLQLSEDESGPVSDTRVQLQYVMSLGAHGAHQF